MMRLLALSVSNSPDLDRLGLFDRSLRLTVSALATALIRKGWRVAYGGNLDRSGFTYTLYPAVAEAYRSLAVQTGRSPFVHFVARYQWQEPRAIIEHIEAVAGFAEICLVDGQGHVHSVRMRNREFVLEETGRERRVANIGQLAAILREMPQIQGQDADDLSAMRRAMEAAVEARILIGGQVSGYRGIMPGVVEEALNTLQARHLLIVLGGFGGAARDVAVELGLLYPEERLQHVQTGRGYREALANVSSHAVAYRHAMDALGIWEDLVAAARAEDPEHITRHIMRLLARYEPVARR